MAPLIFAMLSFKNKILFVGYGAVAQCALPILVKHLKTPASNITVMDFENRKPALAPVAQARRQVRRTSASPAKTWARCWANISAPATS